MVMQEGWASEPKRRTTRRDSSESWGMLVGMGGIWRWDVRWLGRRARQMADG
jgi:hypothetical protein